MRIFLLALPLLFASPAFAEVVSAGANGFHVRHSVPLVVPQERAFEAFERISGWWDPDHSYSGDASNLRFSATPSGCFCERLPNGGGVEHLRVAYVEPGERIVLTGSLGPLLYEATSGVMDVRFERIAGGTRVVMDYKVSGFAGGGGDKLAGPVDQVLAVQMRRYREFARSQLPNR